MIREQRRTAQDTRQVLLQHAPLLAWAATLLLTAVIFVPGVGAAYAAYQTLCLETAPSCLRTQLSPLEAAALAEQGISPVMYARVRLAATLVETACVWTVGALLLRRRGADRMTWLVSFILIGWSLSPYLSLLEMARPEWNLLTRVLRFVTVSTLLPFLFLFPDGRFVPRWTAAPALVWIIVYAGTYLLPGSALDTRTFPEWMNTVPLLLFAATLYAQVYRYRHATPLQRQQMKWFVVGLAAFTLIVTVDWIADRTWHSRGVPTAVAMDLVTDFSPLAIIGGIVIAILRHRLWDVDVIIRRTLVYSTLTACLALIYVGVVTLLQRAMAGLTGQESALAVVVSTLTIAALFNPLRRRLQQWIDRRFYRRQYDAEQTLEEFRQRLRHRVDPDGLRDEVLGVAGRTLQPVYLSLWLRPPAQRFSRSAEP